VLISASLQELGYSQRLVEELTLQQAVQLVAPTVEVDSSGGAHISHAAHYLVTFSAVGTLKVPILREEKAQNERERHQRIHLEQAAYVPNQLRFAVINDHPNSQSAVALFSFLNERLRSMSGKTAALCTQVESEKEAELILRVQPQRVELDRRDAQMSCLNTARPHIDAWDVGLRFPEVMGGFARFNFHIQRESSLRPFHDCIDVRLHLLQKSERDHQEFMVPGREIFFKNMEAIVSQDDAIYCLVLHNSSKQPLFPYVVRPSMSETHLTTTDTRQFHFDPTSYAVELFYAPISPHEAPLKPGGKLQLGRSSDSMTAMSFFVTGGQELDTGFLKVGALDGLRHLDIL
jgi:hypothetical protein